MCVVCGSLVWPWMVMKASASCSSLPLAFARSSLVPRACRLARCCPTPWHWSRADPRSFTLSCRGRRSTTMYLYARRGRMHPTRLRLLHCRRRRESKMDAHITNGHVIMVITTNDASERVVGANNHARLLVGLLARGGAARVLAASGDGDGGRGRRVARPIQRLPARVRDVPRHEPSAVPRAQRQVGQHGRVLAHPVHHDGGQGRRRAVCVVGRDRVPHAVRRRGEEAQEEPSRWFDSTTTTTTTSPP